jgi:CRP-like cAMP-binding protein
MLFPPVYITIRTVTPMINSATSRQNHLLGALPADNYTDLFSQLEFVKLSAGDVLYEPGEVPHYAYFPTTCIVSKYCINEDGASTEIAMIGKEGMIGIALFMGGGTMPNRAVVITPGHAYRLRRKQFLQEIDRQGEPHISALNRVLLRYTLALITYMGQMAACNRHHAIEQQLSRWLLLSLDRLNDNQVITTQASIADKLGVRREGITEAAGKLQRTGLIRYSRGHITVVNRAGLEARSCECYQVVKSEFDQLQRVTKA